MTPSGDGDRRLTPCDFYAAAPAWSPDGDEIAFLGRPASELALGRFLHLYVVHADGGGPRVVVRDVQTLNPSGLPSDEPAYDRPSWSPDGRSIAFARRRLFRSFGVYVVGRADGKPRPLASAKTGSDPAWAR